MAETLEAIGDRLSPERVVERRKAAVWQRFRRVRESVMGSPDYEEPTAQAAREKAAAAASSAADTARTMAGKVQHAPEAVSNTTAGNPLAAGLIAFGAGLVLATAFPTTQTEQHLLDQAQPQIDRAKDELRDAGQQLSGDVRDEAKRAIEQTTSSGKEAVSAVADEARSSAQTVSETARRETQS
jgi:gas vesicle protein